MDDSVTFSRVSFNTSSLDKDSHTGTCVGERVRGVTGAGVGAGVGASVGSVTGAGTGTGAAVGVTGAAVGLTGLGVGEGIGADVFGGDVTTGTLDCSLVGFFVGLATGDDGADGIDMEKLMLL